MAVDLVLPHGPCRHEYGFHKKSEKLTPNLHTNSINPKGTKFIFISIFTAMEALPL